MKDKIIKGIRKHPILSIIVPSILFLIIGIILVAYIIPTNDKVIPLIKNDYGCYYGENWSICPYDTSYNEVYAFVCQGNGSCKYTQTFSSIYLNSGETTNLTEDIFITYSQYSFSMVKKGTKWIIHFPY